MLIENAALKRQIKEAPVRELTEAMERYKLVNRRLSDENEEIRYKYEVAERLRAEMKEYF